MTPLLVVGCVIVLGVVGFFFAQGAKKKEALAALKNESRAHMAKIEESNDPAVIGEEIAWFREHPEHTEMVGAAELTRHEKRQKTLELAKAFQTLDYDAAALEEKGELEPAKLKLRAMIDWCTTQGDPWTARIDGINARIARLDPQDESAQAALGKEFVEVGIDMLGSYRPFFPSKVDDLTKLGEGKWLPTEQATELKARIAELSEPILALQAEHAGDPLFARSLVRVNEILKETGFEDEDFQAFYDSGCLVLQANSGGRKARRHLAIMNLASMKFAQAIFDEYAKTLPHELERTPEPMVMVSLKDKGGYDSYCKANGMEELAKFARAYFMPGKLWIITYNENIFSSRYFGKSVDAMVGTSVHEATHHIRYLHKDGGVPLQCSHWFEEGWAEYSSGISVKFDQKAETCTIKHCGWNNARMEPYCGEGGRDNQFFKPLSLEELVGLHSKADEERIAKERVGGGYSEGAKRSISTLVYSQGFSFIYFCYEGSSFKYKKQMDEWRSWQWSDECMRAHFGGGHAQAWKKFKQIFGDVDKVEKEWKEWELSLDTNHFTECSPTGDDEKDTGSGDEDEDEDEDEEGE